MRNYPRQAIVLSLLFFANSGYAADYVRGFNAYSEGDYATALAEWQPLAEQGDSGGQFGLGLLYANGWGVPQSDDKAFEWYSVAADLGFPAAQISLGKMYSIGFGAPLDIVQAHMWYSVAALLGDFNAEFDRDELARTMSEEDVAKAEALAQAWLTNFEANKDQ